MLITFNSDIFNLKKCSEYPLLCVFGFPLICSETQHKCNFEIPSFFGWINPFNFQYRVGFTSRQKNPLYTMVTSQTKTFHYKPFVTSFPEGKMSDTLSVLFQHVTEI